MIVIDLNIDHLGLMSGSSGCIMNVVKARIIREVFELGIYAY